MIIRFLGWLIHVGEFLIAINLLTLLIAAFVKWFRDFAGGLLYMSTWVWAMTLIFWCAMTVYTGWGWFMTVIGLVLGVVGLVPVAFLYLLFCKEWLNLLELLFQVVLVTGGYYLAKRLMQTD
jgi:hypothetical protein